MTLLLSSLPINILHRLFPWSYSIQRRSCNLSFLFPPRHQEHPGELDRRPTPTPTLRLTKSFGGESCDRGLSISEVDWWKLRIGVIRTSSYKSHSTTNFFKPKRPDTNNRTANKEDVKRA